MDDKLSFLMDFESMDENEVVFLAQQSNQYAYDYLIKKYLELVNIKASAYFMAGADKEDIVQEGLLGLLKAIRNFDCEKGASFKTFADLCILRQIQSAIKLASRNKHKPLNDYASLSEPMEGNSDESGRNVSLLDALAEEANNDPLEMLVDKEYYNNLTLGINNELSDFELEVINLYVDGMSYQEIGVKLGKSAKQIDNALQRTKKKLSKYKDRLSCNQ